MTDDTDSGSEYLKIEIGINPEYSDRSVHSFLREVPWFGPLDADSRFSAVIVDEDGNERDVLSDAFDTE